ncbi:MAG: DUF2892 domain-containing protein [Actinomycetia bacterium]|nr:DUF2892 domain-containing protein [Actinomycetes bacterium]MCP4960004.1 DUF2892 domain-containing protein [Actinomycetes bacterium]
MKINEANTERIARTVLGIVLIIVGFVAVGGTLGALLGIVGLIALVTGAVGFCPLYRLFEFSTAEKTKS